VWTDVSTGIPGGIVSVAAVVPGQDKIIALTGNATTNAFYTSTAWSSIDGGATWQQMGQGTSSQALQLNPLGVAFDPKGSSVFWIYGDYEGSNGGLYKTTDGGNTFTAVTFTGTGKNEVEDVSIDTSSSTVLVAQHAMSQAVYKSTDGGQTWSNIGANLPAGTARSQYTYIVDSNTYLVGCTFSVYGAYDLGGTAGIYRTTDGGMNWSAATAPPNTAVFGPPLAVNGTLYWSYYTGSDGGFGGGILASSDGGVTWAVLIQDHLYYTVSPVPVATGQIGSMTTAKQIMLLTPAAGSVTTLSQTFPLAIVSPVLGPGLIYDPARNAFFAWVANSAIQRLNLN
jgi:photosystem II stability/assembly factor-like uncharacterized protein